MTKVPAIIILKISILLQHAIISFKAKKLYKKDWFRKYATKALRH